MLVHFKYIDLEGQKQDFRLIQDIQADCKTLGKILGVEHGTLERLNEKHRGDLQDICNDVLHIWIVQDLGYYRVTWGGLLEALRDAELQGIAKDLEKAMNLFYK